MLHFIRKFVPKPLLQLYHYTLAKMAAFLYRYPSNKLIVIGVTGTNGKSSTVQFIAQMLESLGHKVGYTTTAGFSIAGQDIENAMKMTMPGRFYLQRLMQDMVKAGCKYAVIETSSEGIKQFRHLGINYDVAVFTNLTPEHIESHGSFEQYKRAKGRLFKHLMRLSRKYIGGKKIQKVSVVNLDDKHAEYFTAFEADELVTFSFTQKEADVFAEIEERNMNGSKMTIGDIHVHVPLLADFQLRNAIAAVSALRAVDISKEDAYASLEALAPIPGRFEIVDKGQPFHVVVDYAYEPYALEALFASVRVLNPNRIIGIHGSAGGGRDKSRREKIGALAAKEEDIVIVTNEDPYDEDPRAIIEEVARGASSNGKKEGKDLFLIDDRTEAIAMAIALAEKGDAVVITGKGSEPVMAVAGGKKISWSDRDAAEKALKDL